MRFALAVRSRIGNALLGVIGAVYVVAACTLLVYAVVQTWRAASMIDYAVQMVLVVAAIVGAVFLETATENLGIHPRQWFKARHARPNQKAAEVRS